MSYVTKDNPSLLGWKEYKITIPCECFTLDEQRVIDFDIQEREAATFRVEQENG